MKMTERSPCHPQPRKKSAGLILLLVLSLLAMPGHLSAQQPIPKRMGGMNYKAVFEAPPRNVPTKSMPDGPLLGNGDVGVVLAGPPEAQRFHIGKNDFWTRHPGNASIITVGTVSLFIPELQGASYHQEQNLATAQVDGTF
ncbi:MAG: hypothetical protein NTX27_21460, partial [Verrucomicrobia bacterium]|nr:hypothetical protein [Verrucomicrobiota bacterium]